MKWLKKFIEKYRLDLWIIEGEELNSQTSLSILCSASDWDRNYLARLIFGETYYEHYIGSSWLWSISKIALKTNREYSIVFIEVKNKRLKFLEAGHWFHIPVWVGGTTDLPLQPMITRKESLKSDIRKIEKNTLQFEITHNEQYFDDFYYNMHIPYIKRAHSDSAYILPYENVKQQFNDGDLLLVKKEKKYIAGMLITYSGTKPRLKVLGVRDGCSEYLNYGAIGALYHFSLQYLEKKGFSKVSYGLSRAFLQDGVLQYKRKWGQKIDDISSVIFAFKILSNTRATQMFLENNPFISYDQGSFIGYIFLHDTESISSQELKQIKKDYFYPGLSKLIIYLTKKHTLQKQNTKTGERYNNEPNEYTQFIILYK